MSGRGKGKSAKKAVSRSAKAGLQVGLGLHPVCKWIQTGESVRKPSDCGARMRFCATTNATLLFLLCSSRSAVSPGI